MADTILMRGMSRARQGHQAGVPLPNDQGVIFATTDRRVAERYANGFGGHGGEAVVLTFRLLAGARVLNLADAEQVEALAEEIAAVGRWLGADLDDPDTRAAFVAETIAHADEASAEGGLMDDPGVIEAVANLGYDAVTDGATHVIVNPDALAAL